MNSSVQRLSSATHPSLLSLPNELLLEIIKQMCDKPLTVAWNGSISNMPRQSLRALSQVNKHLHELCLDASRLGNAMYSCEVTDADGPLPGVTHLHLVQRIREDVGSAAMNPWTAECKHISDEGEEMLVETPNSTCGAISRFCHRAGEMKAERIAEFDEFDGCETPIAMSLKQPSINVSPDNTSLKDVKSINVHLGQPFKTHTKPSDFYLHSGAWLQTLVPEPVITFSRARDIPITAFYMLRVEHNRYNDLEGRHFEALELDGEGNVSWAENPGSHSAAAVTRIIVPQLLPPPPSINCQPDIFVCQDAESAGLVYSAFAEMYNARGPLTIHLISTCPFRYRWIDPPMKTSLKQYVDTWDASRVDDVIDDEMRHMGNLLHSIYKHRDRHISRTETAFPPVTIHCYANIAVSLLSDETRLRDIRMCPASDALKSRIHDSYTRVLAGEDDEDDEDPPLRNYITLVQGGPMTMDSPAMALYADLYER